MVSSVASTSISPFAASPKHSSKKALSKERKHRSDKRGEGNDSHRSSSMERRKSKREVVTGSSAKDRDEWKGKKVSGPKESAFQYMYPIIDIPIPPTLIHEPHRAADELMDTLLMRYVPQLSGVLLSHRNISFLRSHAKIDGDGAYSIAPAGLTCLVWAPTIGMRLEGEIKLSTPSHVSLLVHGIFNASITSAHLPSNLDASSSRKDIEYRWHQFEEAEEEIKEEPRSSPSADNGEPSYMLEDDVGEKSTGNWVNVETGEKLGGKEGKVVFTVVGMTIANHMLSIYGSLLRKPYSIAAPTYVPSLATISTNTTENARRVRFNETDQTSTIEEHEALNEGDSDDDELPDTNAVSRPEVVQQESKKKKRTKVGPRREGEVSGSESEGEGKREKKKRKKE